MMKKTVVFATMIVACGALLFNSCVNDKGALPQTAVPDGCDTTQVTYTNSIKNIINTNCAKAGCHSQGSPYDDFTTYSGVMVDVNNGKMEDYVYVRKTMPLSPNPPLSSCDKAKLQAWIHMGGPQ